MLSGKYVKSMKGNRLLIFLFLGVLAGIAVVQMQSDSAFAGIFSEFFLNQYAMMQIDYRSLLRYVASCRISQYMFLVCVGGMSGSVTLLYLFIFFLGMAWGTVAAISALRLGMKGILICVFGMIPHVLFYVLAFGWVFLWTARKGSDRRRYLLLSVLGGFLLVFGILTEVYINPRFFQQMMHMM